MKTKDRSGANIMASDYGDEAGEKLFDWMLRMGQDASQTLSGERREAQKRHQKP